ncbi:MAG: hypothetical protein K9W44_08035 [Candidatus Lokiarchaeota archaeon]|nr:hypothetical protein [Candidatus Harpocratesius repetitus]
MEAQPSSNLGKSGLELDKLDEALKLVRTTKTNISHLFNELERVISTTKLDIIELREQQEYLEEEKIRLQKKAQDQQKAISGLTQEQHQLLEEYANVKLELEKLTKLASGDENVSIQDMRATLAIYTSLFSEVYSTEAHFKILLLLHGESGEMTIEQLKNASGIGGAIILRACHELHKANLIHFDFETKTATLVNRLFPERKSN